jgi:glycosyltransferase involved in cell wall biosynthesis
MGSGMPELSIAVVIVTRNRPEALRMSLPLLLDQTRPPQQVLVVDSSDDPDPIADIVAQAAVRAPFPVRCIRSAPGMTLQRNVGLDHVTEAVVVFPDDDSLLYPGALAELAAVYERDESGEIGGVAMRAVPAPPPTAQGVAPGYATEKASGAWSALSRMRWHVENSVIVDPFVIHGRAMNRLRATPDWLPSLDVRPVPYMVGYSMSYRTPLIAAARFDEALGLYALSEDVDASFSILATHQVVVASRALVHHYRFPGKRHGGRRAGVTEALNRAYILYRHSAPGSAARWRLWPFLAQKLAQLALRSADPYERERLGGFLAALRRLPSLSRARPGALTERYLAIRERCVSA